MVKWSQSVVAKYWRKNFNFARYVYLYPGKWDSAEDDMSLPIKENVNTK